MAEPLTELGIVIRLCLGFLAGGIIGFERSSRRQVAGLRTHILISLGATCLMMLSIWLPQYFSGTRSADPGRIAAQVVSGIGFLGAGAIIRLGGDVKGLTTAASLWLVAAIGMTIGAGMYIAALAAEALALVALMLLSPIERKIFPEIRNKTLEIHYSHGGEPDMESILEVFKNFNIKSQSIDSILGKHRKKTKICFVIGILDTINISKLVKALKASGDIEHVEIKEKY
jgi:putative Mg2+ transporter-C (MgtC) family protein